ncbi:MAG: hypothetical protein KY475_22105 [Planctomycetes bacterium]|nr:hypothetical protein [Planctomycetota bacterium]
MDGNRRKSRFLPAALAAGVWLLAAARAEAQLLVSDTGVGYIDHAIPADQLRLRFDAAYGATFPDRAEFFYGAWGRLAPGAPGPPLRERNVDFQELRAHLEVAPLADVSIFVETPVRFINPTVNANSAGLGDLNLGAKWAFVQTDWAALTFQFRTYVPTGDADRGLGTDHVSLEPGLLGFCRITDRLIVEGELRDWIPVGGTDGFAGNVLRYGIGTSYLAHEESALSIRPVVEFVGWSVLDGAKSSPAGVFDAAGDTIVNGKFGLRVGVGENGDGLGGRHSIYAGYGRSLTGHVWYEDVMRLEYRLAL